MPTIYLVRHGQAAAGFGTHPDPGLSKIGRAQAAAAASQLAKQSQMPVYTSPLARARETAEPLCQLWGVTAEIEPRIAEIPAPTDNLEQRSAWLQRAMAGRWSDLSATYSDWRDGLIKCLLAAQSDTLMFSHFVAINAAVGAANDDDRMLVFRPDNASITRIANDNGTLKVLELGASALTKVN